MSKYLNKIENSICRNETTEFYISIKHKTFKQIEAEEAGDISTTPMTSTVSTTTEDDRRRRRKRQSDKGYKGDKGGSNKKSALWEALLNLVGTTTTDAPPAGRYRIATPLYPLICIMHVRNPLHGWNIADAA